MSDTMAFAVGTSSCWYSLTMTVAYLGFVTDSKQLCVASFVIAVSLVRPYLPSSGSTCHRREVQSQCLNLWWRPGKPSMAELISEAFRCFCRYDVCCICLSKDAVAAKPRLYTLHLQVSVWTVYLFVPGAQQFWLSCLFSSNTCSKSRDLRFWIFVYSISIIGFYGVYMASSSVRALYDCANSTVIFFASG